MSTGTVELARSRGKAVGIFAAGVMLALLGVVSAMRGANAVGAGFIGGLGAVVMLAMCMPTFARTPRLRATTAGVWFGGGAVIPWREIKAIYEANIDVRSHMVRTKTSAIAFDFRRRATLFRTPILGWLAAPFSVGDLDISPADSIQRSSVIAARLEAMRVVAVGHEDGVSPGAGELPAARIVSQDD